MVREAGRVFHVSVGAPGRAGRQREGRGAWAPCVASPGRALYPDIFDSPGPGPMPMIPVLFLFLNLAATAVLAADVGSEGILRACWTPAQLAGRAEERIIQHRLKPDREPPPAWAMEAALAGARPLPIDLRGSIRQVEPADPLARLVALTFDLCEQAGERAGYDAGVVDWLRAHGVKATFFAGGQWMRTHAERAMQLMADPLFELGNHTWTHANLRTIQGAEARDQIVKTQAEYGVLRRDLAERACAAGVGPGDLAQIPAWPSLFRFPYGTCSAETLAAAADLGLASIQWTVVSADPDKSQNAQSIARTVLAGVRRSRGAIVVSHANGRGWHTAEALPIFVPRLQADGYRFVTASELLAAGRPVAADSCYELSPGDNRRYDTPKGRGAGG
jgi:peptidoglycan-N-acetylglucosamine deacetylase